MPSPDTASVARFFQRDAAELPDPLHLTPIGAPFRATVRPPGSKSLTNRALLLAALAGGESVVQRALLDAVDTRRMLGALARLGIGQTWLSFETGDISIQGAAGRFSPPDDETTLELENAGTAVRFLTAAACLADKPVTIDGNERMRQRPIGELVELLRNLGASIDYLADEGFVPLRINPKRIKGGTIDVGRTLSSQYVSALMLIAPWLEDGLTLHFTGDVTSPTYIRMTGALLNWVGAQVEVPEPDARTIRVAHKPIDAFTYIVEPDASGATYFWGAAAVVPGASCLVQDLHAESLQGDTRFVDVLARMGATVGRSDAGIGVSAPQVLKGIDIDLSPMPDAAMTLGAVACFAEGPTTIRGLRTLRVKETDRIHAIATELAKVGASVEVLSSNEDEAIRITPPGAGIDTSPDAPPVVFDTYDDHRMAMSLAIIGLRRPNVAIRDPACVRKTYPGFWRDWASLFAPTA